VDQLLYSEQTVYGKYICVFCVFDKFTEVYADWCLVQKQKFILKIIRNT